MGVPPGSGDRMGIDRNANAVADLDEALPTLDLTLKDGLPEFAWPVDHYWLVLERNESLLDGDWQPVTHPRVTVGGIVNVLDAWAGGRGFYRLRRP
jgi:hypothetical protein